MSELSRRARLRGWIGCVVLLASACQSESVTCARAPDLGVQVHVQDATTAASLDALVTVTVSRLSAPFDSLSGDPRTAVILTSSRPGRYHVRVTAPGYVESARDVEVPTSTRRCASVEPQFVVIALVRE